MKQKLSYHCASRDKDLVYSSPIVGLGNTLTLIFVYVPADLTRVILLTLSEEVRVIQ